MSIFADIILPLPLPKLYTYAIPKHLINTSEQGKRAIIQFGSKKIYTGIIRKIHNNKPPKYETKDISSILDEKPIITEKQFEFWEWLANYYLCTLGDVYKAALPSGLRLESETNLFINPNYTDFSDFSETDIHLFKIIEANHIINVQKLSLLSEKKDIIYQIKNLIEKKAIVAEETIKETYKPKFDTVVSINPIYLQEDAFNNLFSNLEKAPKQLELFMKYIQLSSFNLNKDAISIPKKDITNNIKNYTAAFNTLVKKEVFILNEIETSRLSDNNNQKKGINSLNPSQQKAYNEIQNAFTKNDVVLLHGVTSSGKTEIYIHLIQDQLKQGKQVLYLLPEIALTTQIITRLIKAFGNQVGVFHSKFNDAQRVEIWKDVCSNQQFKLILGVRSSVFLPFSNLGLIIIDEEHENTYKQYDPAPRYHARDAAIYLAKINNAKTLMGTATPAIESYFNVQNNKYGLVEIKERYKDIQLPEIILIDTKLARSRKQMKSIFSEQLIQKIGEALAKKEQVILFQNRRGFSSFVECTACGWVPRCTHCDVSLTYHKHFNQLICHYCGFSTKLPPSCSACGTPGVQTRGIGTEKIEEEIALFFPGIRTARLDLDTTRSRKSYEQIISNFEEGNIDILIGTQMISKGLNFDDVSLVGIVNADNMLNFPDFRSFERSFQLMAQVSGRAGRMHKRGTVIIQCSNPEHEVLKDVLDNNFLSLYHREIKERKFFKYPPFYRFIQLSLKHKKPDILDNAARTMTNDLIKNIGAQRVLGPQEPIISKIQNYYIKNILIKAEKDISIQFIKNNILNSIEKIKNNEHFKSIIINADVDPY